MLARKINAKLPDTNITRITLFETTFDIDNRLLLVELMLESDI